MLAWSKPGALHSTLVRNLGQKHVCEWIQSCTTQMLSAVHSHQKPSLWSRVGIMAHAPMLLCQHLLDYSRSGPLYSHPPWKGDEGHGSETRSSCLAGSCSSSRFAWEGAGLAGFRIQGLGFRVGGLAASGAFSQLWVLFLRCARASLGSNPSDLPVIGCFSNSYDMIALRSRF